MDHQHRVAGNGRASNLMPRRQPATPTRPQPTPTPEKLSLDLETPVTSYGQPVHRVECALPIDWWHGRGMYAVSLDEIRSGPSVPGLIASLFGLSSDAISAMPALDVLRLDHLVKPYLADFPDRESLVSADDKTLTVRFCQPGAFPSRPGGAVTTALPIRYGSIMPMFSARPDPCFFMTIEKIIENLFGLKPDELGRADCREVNHLFASATPFFILNS